MNSNIEPVVVLEAYLPTAQGHVYPLRVVKNMVKQFKAREVQVLSSYDPSVTVEQSQVVGKIVDAEIVDDKLVLHFERTVLPSLIRVKYDWSISGFCWFKSYIVKLPRVIGYTGPDLYEIQDGFTVECVVRKPVFGFGSPYSPS